MSDLLEPNSSATAAWRDSRLFPPVRPTVRRRASVARSPTSRGATQRFDVVLVAVFASSIWVGLASPRFVGVNIAAAVVACLGLPVATSRWVIDSLEFQTGRRRRTDWRTPCALGIVGLLLWVGLTEAGFRLRFHWSRPALERFVADPPAGDDERYAPRWVGLLHVGGVRQVGGSTLLYVANGLYHEIGIARVKSPPQRSPGRLDDGPFLLVPPLDPPWHYVSYE
jgi:hypothetical protein